MDKLIGPKVEPVRPVAPRPATAPLSEAALQAATTKAPDADQAKVSAGKLGLDSPSRTAPLPEIPEVDFGAVDAKPAPEPPKEESFTQKALGFFSSALSFTAKAALGPAAIIADQSFLSKVKDWFSPSGNDTLSKLAQIGKLAASDANLTTLREVLRKLILEGADPAAIEAINQQILHPENIEQMPGKTTCPTAVVQQMLAANNPGAYAEAANDLLTKGTTTLPDGTVLTISPENMKWLKEQNLPPGELVNALFQVALAEAMVKPNTYNVATDAVNKDFGIFDYNDRGGIDFSKILEWSAKHGWPAFDPRPLEGASSAEQAAALQKALAAAGPEGLPVPVHSQAGGEERYHMVRVTQIDENGNVTVRDPRTGKESTYTQAQFLQMVGWDISAYDNVGGGRVTKPGGGGDGSV